MKKLSVFAVTAALSGLSGINFVQAFNPQPDPPAHFGMLGITHDQTARLNVVAQPNHVGDVQPGPCRVALSFRDRNGRLLSDFILTKTLIPGQATFFDTVAISDPNLRKEIRPVVRVLANPPPVPACQGVVGTAEVFDVTGRTSVLYSDPNSFVDPELRTALRPAHFGMVGITHDQTARLNVVARPTPVDVPPWPMPGDAGFPRQQRQPDE